MAPQISLGKLRGLSGLGCDCNGGGLGGLGAQAYLDDFDAASDAEQIRELEPLEPLPGHSREPFSAPARRRAPRKLKHGSTVWCVFLGKRKKTCHKNMFSAKKAARALRSKRYKGTRISVRKMKHKLSCPTGGRRVCRTKKGGACVKWGCSSKKGKKS